MIPDSLRGARRQISRVKRQPIPAAMIVALVHMTVAVGAATTAAEPPDHEWSYPFCGPQPTITAVFDHEHPTYSCPPNGGPDCRGNNGVIRLYNDTVDNRRLYEGHNGWDYRTRHHSMGNLKRPVFAVADGIVTYAGWHHRGNPLDPDCQSQVIEHEIGYGLMLRIDHGGMESLYAHLSMLRVQRGARVLRGQHIGATGNTGNSGGPHLHFGAFMPDAPELWHGFDPYGWNADWSGVADRPLDPRRDPWHAAGGPTSQRMILPSAPDTGPCPRTCGPSTIIDDRDPGFATGCDQPPCRWRQAPEGFRHQLHHVHPAGAQPDQWARWTAALPPGRYQVDVFIPATGRAAVHAARYILGDSLDAPVAIVDQHEEGNIWVPLGVHRYRAAPSVTLLNGSHLEDNWTYRGPCRVVVADAVRFTPLCDTSRNEPVPSGETVVSRSSSSDASASDSSSSIALGSLAQMQTGYPGPTTPPTPTATPAPDGGGLYPPPAGVPHEIIDLQQVAPSLGLDTALQALATGDAAALAALTGGLALALDPPLETEGWGLRLGSQMLMDLLSDGLEEGAPVIQGFFGPGCMPLAAECAIHLVITGWPATRALPTAERPIMGPPRPTNLPRAAAWQLLPDGAGGLWWRAWHATDGYHELLQELSAAGLGTYYVAR